MASTLLLLDVLLAFVVRKKSENLGKHGGLLALISHSFYIAMSLHCKGTGEGNKKERKCTRSEHSVCDLC